MVTEKGANLEELVRLYYAKQNCFALRSVRFQYDSEDVTDIDVWVYSRPSASVRLRGIVDVKNKRSPKAFERVLWVKGLQTVLRCDRATIATTDRSPALISFAGANNVAILPKSFLERFEKKIESGVRWSLEEFQEFVKLNPGQKYDGDWLAILAGAKSAVIGSAGFPAFNRSISAFNFFGQRAEIRAQFNDQALRCALASAALACISLDMALERFIHSDMEARYHAIVDGVNFGDAGDSRVKRSLDQALLVITEGMQNGKAIAAHARETLKERLAGIRSDVIAEHFMREQNAYSLFAVAIELEEHAHSAFAPAEWRLSSDARAVLGVFADFSGIKRNVFLRNSDKKHPAGVPVEEDVTLPTGSAVPEQGKLL